MLIPTKSELAKALNIGRVTLDRYLKFPGAPKARPNGFWDGKVVSEWIAHCRAVGTSTCESPKSEEVAALKLMKLRAETKKAELDLSNMANEFGSWKTMEKAVNRFRDLMRKATLENNLIPSETKKRIVDKFDKFDFKQHVTEMGYTYA